MSNTLQSVHPELVSEWSDKNLPLTPDKITFGSNKRVWWKGSCGHEWQASVKARSGGEKCPICSGARVVEGINDLATLKPQLAQEWSKKNELKPTEVSVASHKKVIWKCKNGHEWTASIKSRTVNGTGCPYCSHNKVLAGFNDLASQYPEVAAEWSDRNLPLQPTMVTAFANSKAWWKCKDCGNEWYTLIATRSGGSKCPYSFEMSDDTGVLLGINRHNNSLCIVDLFNTKKNKNANLNLLGTSGAGKTFTMQLLALRMRMRGIQCFILAPIKGHEFRRACKKIGGEFIKIAPGSPHCINIMEIRHTISPEMELIDEIDYSEMDSMLARKIQQLMTFFSLLIPDMSNEEEQMLDEALIQTYAKFGITHDNDSLYIDRSVSPPKMKKMPIIGDLHKELLENPMTKRIAIIISRFVTGSAQSFNQQTNVDLSNKYIVLDLSELKGKLLPVGMFIALDYVWDTVKADRTKKKAIMIDEIWQLIGASSNRMAAEFCLTIFKTIRGFGGAAVSATQDLSDFFGLEDGKYGRAIINNSKNKIILNLEPDEAKYVQEVLKLTKTEIRSVTRFERGEALVCSNNNKVPVVIKASKEEQEMITTDRAELEALLKERQQEQTHSA